MKWNFPDSCNARASTRTFPNRNVHSPLALARASRDEAGPKHCLRQRRRAHRKRPQHHRSTPFGRHLRDNG
eukprot:3087696-Alexandrium_andersonii.AAC.1